MNFITTRKNQTHTWNPSDSEDNYKLIQPDGSVNYSIADVSYKFNSSGFRCDDFVTGVEDPVLFLGCSFTDGIGLPMHEVWTHYVHQRIQALPRYQNKKLPFWSLAVGGSGVDSMASLLNTFADSIKPKYIVFMLSSLQRREYKFVTDFEKWWWPGGASGTVVDKIFSDPVFSMHTAARSFMIINRICQLYGTKCFVFGLPNIDVFQEAEKHLLFDNFSSINYISVIMDRLTPPINDPTYATLKHKPSKARDSMHHGALWQYQTANFIWDNIKSEIDI